MSPSLASDRVEDGDVLRVVSFLNRNGYSTYPALNGILQFDVVNPSDSNTGIEPEHMKIIQDF